jgi:hypothetical protein
MKILAGALAVTLLAAPAFAQSGGSNSTAPAAGADQGKPADSTAPADDANAAPKPAGTATPEPEQAPEGTTPVKPADTPSR